MTASTAALNLLLNLEYLGAQFYVHAANGAGLPAELLTGIGVPGAATGGRKAALADSMLVEHAAELAAERKARVIALRARLGAAAAAQPALNLSPSGPFGTAASGAGLAGLDPFAGDGPFLLGAMLVEHVVAAAYRTTALNGTAGEAAALVEAHLADAIYHGALVRSLVEARAGGDPTLAAGAAALCAHLARLDGSDTGDQSLASVDWGGSATLVDGAQRPIPFSRGTGQVMKSLYLTDASGSVGGFLPGGANGVQATI